METQPQPQPKRDYLTEILWLLSTARNLASDSGRDELAQEMHEILERLQDLDDEF